MANKTPVDADGSLPYQKIVRSRKVIRIADLVIASAALLLLLPLMLVVAAVIYIADPGAILFRHKRIGRNGVSFYCLKFRSMVMDADARLAKLLTSDPAMRALWERDHKLPNDPRITSIGRFLRASSIDELPQLINVLRGEMSLVGPRPIVEAEIVRYGRYIADYYNTVPGVTGLWQISGRSHTTYQRRVALDVAYSRSQGIPLYFRILIMTVPAVIFARGSY